MKKNLIFILLLIIIFSLSACSNKDGKESYTYQVTEEFHSIDIEWNFGTIWFYDSDETKIVEKTNISSSITNQLTYSVSENTLIINYNNKKSVHKDLDLYLDLDKTYNNTSINGMMLEVFLKNLSTTTIEFDVNLGHVYLDKLYTDSLDMDIVYGLYDITFNDCILKELKYSSERSEVFFKNTKIENVEIYNYAGNVHMEKSQFNFAYFYQKSGEVLLDLSGHVGYTFEVNTLTDACVYYIDFETENVDNCLVYRSGDYKYKFDLYNANLNITRYY